MSKKIQIGEKVIGSTGYGRIGARQFYGRYAGKNNAGEHLIQEDPTWNPIEVISIRRFDDPFERITWEMSPPPSAHL